MLQIPGRIRRQGFIGGLSGLAPVAVAGVATAGVFRNEIADIVSELVGKSKIIGLKWVMFNNLVLYRSYLYLIHPYSIS